MPTGEVGMAGLDLLHTHTLQNAEFLMKLKMLMGQTPAVVRVLETPFCMCNKETTTFKIFSKAQPSIQTFSSQPPNIHWDFVLMSWYVIF